MITKKTNSCTIHQKTNYKTQEHNQSTQLLLPTKLILIGYYHEPILHGKLHTNVKHEDAFLIDNPSAPHQAVRLTGDSPRYTPFPLRPWQANFNRPSDYLYHDDDGMTYYIDISQDNQQFLNQGSEITLQSIIDIINSNNQSNHEQSLKGTSKQSTSEKESEK